MPNTNRLYGECEDAGAHYETIPLANWSEECDAAIRRLTPETKARYDQGPGNFTHVPRGCTWVGSEPGHVWTQTYSNTKCSTCPNVGAFDWGPFPLVCRLAPTALGQWTARAAAEVSEYRSVTFGNGIFVAVSSSASADGASRVMTSPDGVVWTARDAANKDTFWFSVKFGGGIFVATAFDDTAVHPVMTSLNGITWTVQTAPQRNWQGLTYGSGIFVAVAPGVNASTDRVMISSDGTTWTAQAAAEANAFRSVAHGSGMFVAVSSDGVNRVMTPPDGASWTARAASDDNYWRSVAYGSGVFVAVAGDHRSDGTTIVMTPPKWCHVDCASCGQSRPLAGRHVRRWHLRRNRPRRR